ncbi:MAG: cytochrome c3 family protein [Bacteroidetes bacterium]|nr:cytochrome c3 family protein [Bacteroidota bacterium]
MNYRGPIIFGIGFLLSLIIGWFLFPMALYKSEAQPLQYNHKLHVTDQGMSCEDCHAFAESGAFQGIPAVSKCAECHAEPIGETDAEKILVEEYITPNKEIPWKVYSRQPDNAYFSHASHVTIGKMDCKDCHGSQGESEQLRTYQVNRISGYSRDIWGPNISGIQSESWQGMKMDKCIRCHDDRGRRDGCIACHK